ncbi:MAG: hypothetical protein ACKVOP_14215 [Sphingomonadaceae bacterium]
MRRAGLAMAAAVLLIGATYSGGSTHLKIALEDKLDTNPRQVALGLQSAGRFVGLIISWTDRLRNKAD